MEASRVLVLISGSGTNLQALIDACSTDKLPSAQIIHVISNRKDAYGLTRAKNAGIETTYHNLVRYKKLHPNTPEGIQAAREEYDVELASIILEQTPDIVVCAGWMHILSSSFVNKLANARVPVISELLHCSLHSPAADPSTLVSSRATN
jgi:phosphoribosylglycinamide formyltransferase